MSSALGMASSRRIRCPSGRRHSRLCSHDAFPDHRATVVSARGARIRRRCSGFRWRVGIVLINVAEWRADILEEHVEELEALYNRRLRSERSPALDTVALRRINRRIEAHADALVLAA